MAVSVLGAGIPASTILGIITAVIAIIGIAAAAFGAVFFLSKSRGTQDSIATLQTTNQAMQVALDYERAERERDKVEAAKERAADKAKCDQQIARLEGKVESMEAHQVDALMGKVGDAMDVTVTKMLDRIEVSLSTLIEKAVNAPAPGAPSGRME